MGIFAISLFALLSCDKTGNNTIAPVPDPTAKSYIKFQDSTIAAATQTCPDKITTTGSLGNSGSNLAFNAVFQNVPGTLSTITFTRTANSNLSNCNTCPTANLNFTKAGTQSSYTSVGGSLTRTQSEINFDVIMQETRKLVAKDTTVTKYHLTGRIVCSAPA